MNDIQKGMYWFGTTFVNGLNVVGDTAVKAAGTVKSAVSNVTDGAKAVADYGKWILLGVGALILLILLRR